ncbi:putative 2-aminoethylphosphonate ABC transporter substrate-binding protein [Atopomonas sediminilitoris]|uniref:putative 2-aminoethylphosphonate ABC transporter substrate-binding protein n=1 Tax=Atopomonas sediminilitoris TaxID=2919919 RepID=UPI001F4E4E34|nr:putative 2-aminoethylphosphonate ABC transporter substrate-binding protein [Atopomonas sediminilitoris]MCJ8170527.1 putative 2-aminoethylphosphonate ABC transporter substrate-binding protein [Atopomonas sediminilitoris]
MRKPLKHWLALSGTLLALSAQANTELTVYTALEAEDLKKYAERFNQAHPDISIKWVRDSTGIITARLLAEKDNPRADAVWGLAGTSLMLLQKEGLLQGYAPKGVEALAPLYRDSQNPPQWVGMDAWMAAICFNTVEAKKHNLTPPQSWQDLTKPEYQNHIVMPHPASSGTGYLDVSAWLQTFGQDKGWAYMDGLHQNIKSYTHSGSKPCKMAASGEAAIGISFAFRGAREKENGAPLELIFPQEGLGWEMEAAAIIKGSKHSAAAQTLMDWVVSKPANELYNEGYAIVAMPGVAKPVKYFPAEPEKLLIKNDFAWAAQNRDSILTQWQSRYEGKAEAQ